MPELTISSQHQERLSRAFYESFLITLAICLLPSKAIGFVVPFVSLLWFLLRSKSGSSFRVAFFISVAWGLLIAFYYWFNKLLGVEYIFSNGLLSFITYSSLLAFAYPSVISSKEYSFEKYAQLMIGIIFIEGCFGIMQRVLAPFFIGANKSAGDVVEGTINPLSFIHGHSGFSNQFFVINMLCFMTFCFPMLLRKKQYLVPFFIGFIAVVLASVGHVFISFILAVVVTFIIFEGPTLLVKPKLLFAFVFILVSMLSVFATLDETVYKSTDRQFNMFIGGETPKSKAMIKVFTKLGEQQPNMHIIGVGPGNYSSRAGIIASGTYGPLSNLFTGIPFLNIGISENFRQYVLDDWKYVSTNLDAFGNSTMYRPFFSLLSVYTEFGGVMPQFPRLLVIKSVFLN